MKISSQSWPLMVIADKDGNPIDGISSSSSEHYVLEKILNLPEGEYKVLRDDATVTTLDDCTGEQDTVSGDGSLSGESDISGDGTVNDSTEEPEGDVIPVDHSQADVYDDPTQLEYYKEYSVLEPKADTLEGDLAQIAAEMQPGEWREIAESGYMAHAMWADKAQWDSSRQRFSYLGHHMPGQLRPTQWAMWDVANGLWHKQRGNQFHPWAGIEHVWGYRSYGKYTQLADGSNIYARFGRLWRQDPETLEWSAWRMHPTYESIGNIEYFPEMNAVVSLMARYAGYENTYFNYMDLSTDEWRRLPLPTVQGRHSLMRYNAARGEIFLLGGDASYRKAQILHSDGSLEQVADAPRNMRIKTDNLIYDPVSGHYLVMVRGWDAELGKGTSYVDFYGFAPERNEWYLIDEWAGDWDHVTDELPMWHFNQNAQPVVAALPEYGVTMWDESTRSGVWLYKHEAQ